MPANRPLPRLRRHVSDLAVVRLSGKDHYLGRHGSRESLQRYAELMAKLSLRDRTLFWSEIWKLSNDTDRLKAAGVQAVYGNAVYKPLAPGFRCVFKISNTGLFYVESVREN